MLNLVQPPMPPPLNPTLQRDTLKTCRRAVIFFSNTCTNINPNKSHTLSVRVPDVIFRSCSSCTSVVPLLICLRDNDGSQPNLQPQCSKTFDDSNGYDTKVTTAV